MTALPVHPVWIEALREYHRDRTSVWLQSGLALFEQAQASDQRETCSFGQVHRSPGITAEVIAWAEEQELEFFGRAKNDTHVIIRARNPDEEFLIKLRWW